MNINTYGYMRVSSADQNEDRQKIELLTWGVPAGNLFCDKLSGKNFSRPEYQKLKTLLKKGDLLVVKSIDRFGRNYLQIQEEWRYITKKLEADIVIIDMPLLDTRRDKDLLGTLISDIVLQLLSYVAETERQYIHQRQAEGIAAAKLRGVRFGRPVIPLPKNFKEIYLRWKAGEISLSEAADHTNMSKNQFKWAARKHRGFNRRS